MYIHNMLWLKEQDYVDQHHPISPMDSVCSIVEVDTSH